MGWPIRRSYVARSEAGTCSTQAAAGKPAGLSHLEALLANSLLVDSAAGDADHEPAETVGKGGSLLDASTDLRGRDLGAVLGLASRVSLAKQAGAEETRDRHREYQRYRCDLSRRHGPTFAGHTKLCSVGDRQGKAFLEGPCAAR